MWNRSLWLVGLFLSCVCSLFSPVQAARSDEQLDREAASQYQGALRFRDIFRDVALKYDLTETDVLNSLFLPSPEAFRTPIRALEASNPEKALELISARGRGTSALHIYRHGVETPFGERGSSSRVFAARGPVTFVMVPGMLQESSDDDMLAEITEVPTAFNQRYSHLLEGVRDFAYDWGELGEKETDLASHVRLGSIDDADGNPLVQLIVLRSAFGSFETVGPIRRSSETYLRRLHKVLERLPPEAYRNLYFVGFSRGTMISLDMLAKLYREGSYPLLRSLRGLITLGGVVYGADLADHPFRPFLPSLPEKTPPPDPMFLMQQAYRLASVLLKDSWDPSSNLKRMAILAKEVNDANEELKTPSRLKWWAQHVLPPEIPIYSINGSMPIQSMALWPFQDVPFYGLGEPDYGVLKTMAAKIQQLTGNYLNDGQITDVKGRMWPGLAERINPRQKPLKVQNLGNVATHHYALGTRSVIKPLGRAYNRFPRKIMIEALGAYVLERQP